MRTLGALAVLSLLAAPVSAGCKLQSCVFPVVGGAAFSVVGMNEMKGGRWILDVDGGLWNMKAGESKGPQLTPSGTQYAFALKREFSRRWGMGVFAAIADMTSEETFTEKSGLAPSQASSFPGGGGDTFPGGQLDHLRGAVGGLFFTRDFRPREKGVRVPFSFGVMAAGVRLKFSHEFQNAGQTQKETFEIHEKSPGFFINLAANVPVREDLLVTPGVYLAHGASVFQSPNYRITRGTTQSGYTTDLTATNVAPVVYTGFLYRPWNLAFNWNMTGLLLDDDDVAAVNAYTVHWTKKWG